MNSCEDSPVIVTVEVKKIFFKFTLPIPVSTRAEAVGTR